MQPYRHPHGPHPSADDGRPVDLYGLPVLPPDEPVPRPAPWRPASPTPRRRGPHDSEDRVPFPDRRVPARARVVDRRVPARTRIVWLGVAGGVVVTAASAAVGAMAAQAVAGLL
ncbi:hypothetical protein [Brevibacterium yomogidense]|uniref:hypothetical protein n=1 Tax=Brevibacterium yomogidense TaxID=946573 RepID=UPI0018DF6A88|nr:hypothetical protein [Brevibacterium yomogidense]